MSNIMSLTAQVLPHFKDHLPVPMGLKVVRFLLLYAPVVQGLERYSYKVVVGGSIPPRRTVLIKGVDMDWRKYRACDGVPAEVFYPPNEDEDSEREARSFCSVCSVKEQCLEDALRLPAAMDQGIWGGTNRTQRVTIRRRRKRKEVAEASGF